MGLPIGRRLWRLTSNGVYFWHENNKLKHPNFYHHLG